MKSKTSSESPEYKDITDDGPVSVFEAPQDVEVVEVHKPLQNKIRTLIDELNVAGKSVVYPSDESKWDQSLFDRLNNIKR